MTVALLDLDVVAFRCAASAENDLSEVAILRADKWVRDILNETQCSEFKGFLTGKNNYRYVIYPLYKAHRKDKPKPRHLQAVRDFLVQEWNAKVCDGYEADDALGMNQKEDTMIVSNDKDLHVIPGKHYNPVTKEFSEVGEYEASYNFWSQMMTGDKSDNVPGFDGTSRASTPKFIKEMLKYMDDFETEVWERYEDKWQFLVNYNLLNIWRIQSDLKMPGVVQNVLAGTNLYEPGQEVTLQLLLSTKPYLSQL